MFLVNGHEFDKCSRTLPPSQVLETTRPPRYQNPGLYFGFLPKAMPIPPSGPSKQHNSIGLQSRQSSSP
ncbi:hypothetical protein GIB67_018328 [Kingdonia uniflora]|uniref:Uncharacterized protein n=1 Tax=Kingdonia uniflora TaxID=39325 RepID=A0A7J7MJ55_9MAGN|nr:hypothetical protein GIB67_018328 [Kingdonia uniflora]